MPEPRLTPEECAMLARIESAEKWESLVYELSVMLPSFIIMGLGICFTSPITTIIGMAIYFVFSLRSQLRQGKAISVMKSLIGKLKNSQTEGDNQP